MSWYINNAVKVTNGEEFSGGILLDGKPTVEYHKCQYCGREIIIVDDSLREGWGWYYGNQCVKPNVYLYSPIILAVKKFHGVVSDEDHNIMNTLKKIYEAKRISKGERLFLVDHISPFTQAIGNNLANLHSRCHPVGKSNQYDWSLRAGKNTIKILCNNCFDWTKNRFQVLLNDGRRVAISVVEQRKETPESVLDDLGLKGTVIEKGGYTGW